MPVYFTDGRKGLVLISKEYEGASSLMHYRTKGSKNGQRLYQYKDGSLTPLGYIHYGIGQGRKKGVTEETDPQERKVRGPSSEDSKRRMSGEWGGADDPEYSRKVLAKVNIPVEKLSEIKQIDSKDDIRQIREDINHRIESWELSDTGRHYNCPNCACAFEMVERGYDVTARRAVDGSNVGDIAKHFKDGELRQAAYSDWQDDSARVGISQKGGSEYRKWQKRYKAVTESLKQARIEARNKLQEVLESQGSGARGIIVVGWLDDYSTAPTTSFHAMNYKIGSDGKIDIYDTQSYRRYNGGCSLSNAIDGFDPRELHYIRTDDLELNDSITQMVYSRGKGDRNK